ncbi:MAG: formylglycine-generating enzyme family protein [Pseudomonadota bacterium]
MNGDRCCTPDAARGPSEHEPSTRVPTDTPPSPAADATPQIAVCAIPGGNAIVGTHHPVIQLDEEGPRRKKKVAAFHMMQTAVTNALFAAFVDDTGYRTEAERYGWSYVFHHQVAGAVADTLGAQEAAWWRRVDGASWRAINGPGTEAQCLPDHPVVHVSWHDAQAFADWAGGRLPTEAEWEHAARGGHGDIPFPWGHREPDDNEFQPCNIWQGDFPMHNTALDGYTATAPARSYEPNGYGLYNMCGNVWEWIAEPLVLRSLSKKKRDLANKPKGSKLLKGGSFLCHKSYCFRYRIAARTGTTPETSTAHQGFRLVFS